MGSSSDWGLREIGWQFQFAVLYCTYKVSAIILKGLSIQIQLFDVQCTAKPDPKPRRKFGLIFLDIHLAWHLHILNSLIIFLTRLLPSGSRRLYSFHCQRIDVAWLVIVAGINDNFGCELWQLAVLNIFKLDYL